MRLVSDVLGIFVIIVLSRMRVASLSILFYYLSSQLRTTANLLRTLFPKFCSLKNLKNHISANLSQFDCELLRIYCGLYVQRICQCRIMFIAIHFYYTDFQQMTKFFINSSSRFTYHHR